jgi:hypothetical protein
VAAGYDNGDIKLLDLRTGTLRWEANVKNGVCALQFDRADIEMNKLVAATLESRFDVFDMRTFHPEKAYASVTQKAHDSTVRAPVSVAAMSFLTIADACYRRNKTSLREKRSLTLCCAQVWTVSHLPQNRDIWMTTGGNGSLCLWK